MEQKPSKSANLVYSWDRIREQFLKNEIGEEGFLSQVRKLSFRVGLTVGTVFQGAELIFYFLAWIALDSSTTLGDFFVTALPLMIVRAAVIAFLVWHLGYRFHYLPRAKEVIRGKGGHAW